MRGDSMLSGLTKLQKQLDALSPPPAPEDAHPVNIQSLAAGSTTERIQAIGNGVQNLKKRIEQLDDLKNSCKALSQTVARAKAVSEAARVASNALREAYEMPNIPAFSDIFGFAWLDIETTFSPAVSGILSTAQKKLAEMQKVTELRRVEADNLGGNLRLAAEAVAETTQKDRENITKEAQVLKESEAKLKEDIKQFNENSPALKEKQEQLQKDIEQFKKQESSLERDITAYNNEVTGLKNLGRSISNMKYTSCPNHESFDSCSHNDLKNAWVRQRNARVNEFNNRQNALTPKSKSIDSRQNQLKEQAATLRTRGDNFKAEVKVREEQGAAIEQRKEELEARYKELTARFQENIKNISELSDSWRVLR